MGFRMTEPDAQAALALSLMVAADRAAGMPDPCDGEAYFRWKARTEEGRATMRGYVEQLPDGEAKTVIARILNEHVS